MHTNLNKLFVVQKCGVANRNNCLAVTRMQEGFRQLHLQHSNFILSLQQPIILAILIHSHQLFSVARIEQPPASLSQQTQHEIDIPFLARCIVSSDSGAFDCAV